MSLNSNIDELVMKLNVAMKNASKESAETDCNSKKIIQTLAKDISFAVFDIISKAKVSTNYTVPQGQADFPCGGLTITQGTGVGSGNVM